MLRNPFYPIESISLLAGSLLLAMIPLAGCSWYGYGDTRKQEMTQQLTEEGLRSEAEGDLSKATKSLSKAAEVDRADVAARLELARLHRKTGKIDEAIQTLQEVVYLTPDDSRAWLELGELYFEQNRYVEANRCFNDALRYDHSLIQAIMYLGNLEEIRESDDQALEYYYRALSIQENYIPAMLRIARIQIRQKESIRAAPILRSVCYCRGATPGQIAEARWLLGLAYGDQQRWDEAVESLKIAIEIHNTPGEDELYYLAYAAWRAENIVLAGEVTQRLLAINPRYLPAMQLQGRLASGPIPQKPGIQNVIHESYSEPPPPPGWENSPGTVSLSDDLLVR